MALLRCVLGVLPGLACGHSADMSVLSVRDRGRLSTSSRQPLGIGEHGDEDSGQPNGAGDGLNDLRASTTSESSRRYSTASTALSLGRGAVLREGFMMKTGENDKVCGMCRTLTWIEL